MIKQDEAIHHEKTIRGKGIDFEYYDPETNKVNNVSVSLNKIEGHFQTTRSEYSVDHHTDLESGLTFTVLENKRSGEIVISFPGLGQGSTIPGIKAEKDGSHANRAAAFSNAQLSAVSGQLAGGVPKCYRQAAAIVAQLKTDNPDKKIITSGFSFGGSIAQYAALKNDTKGYCFNGLAIGSGLQRDIGDKTLDEADASIQHFGISEDWVTDLKGVKTLDKILGALGFRTPGNFGKKYVMTYNDPSAGLGLRHMGLSNYTAQLAVNGAAPAA